jgi:hypothetical protein
MESLTTQLRHAEEVLVGPSTSELHLGNRAVLRTYPLHIQPDILDEARQELIRSKASGVGKFTAKVDGFETKYPHSLTLANLLAANLLEHTVADLSFIRASKNQPNVFADNLHYDARYVGYSQERDIRGTFWRPSKSVELWRQVINLHDKPRHLQMVDASLKDLNEEGVDIYALRPVGQHFPGYTSPEAVPAELLSSADIADRSQIYTIPAYDGDNLPVLEFWSSRLLHAGITGTEGQLMAASGKWVKPGGDNE